MKRLLLMFAVLSAAAYVGCKQGGGERCQIDEDCESGECNKAKGTCSSGEDMDPFDAFIPIDAPADAMIDAMIDAP